MKGSPSLSHVTSEKFFSPRNEIFQFRCLSSTKRHLRPHLLFYKLCSTVNQTVHATYNTRPWTRRIHQNVLHFSVLRVWRIHLKRTKITSTEVHDMKVSLLDIAVQYFLKKCQEDLIASSVRHVLHTRTSWQALSKQGESGHGRKASSKKSLGVQFPGNIWFACWVLLLTSKKLQFFVVTHFTPAVTIIFCMILRRRPSMSKAKILLQQEPTNELVICSHTQINLQLSTNIFVMNDHKQNTSWTQHALTGFRECYVFACLFSSCYSVN